MMEILHHGESEGFDVVSLLWIALAVAILAAAGYLLYRLVMRRRYGS